MNDAVLLPIVLVGMTILRQGQALTVEERARLGLKDHTVVDTLHNI